MPLATNNLETLINMLTALAQRQDALRQLASQLHASTIWRSPDGQLAVALTAGQRTELEAFVKAYLDESDILIAAARTMLASPAGEGG
jgi:hypothetical protein